MTFAPFLVGPAHKTHEQYQQEQTLRLPGGLHHVSHSANAILEPIAEHYCIDLTTDDFVCDATPCQGASQPVAR